MRRAADVCAALAAIGGLLLWPIPGGMWSDGPGILLLFGGAFAALVLQIAGVRRRPARRD